MNTIDQVLTVDSNKIVKDKLLDLLATLVILNKTIKTEPDGHTKTLMIYAWSDRNSAIRSKTEKLERLSLFETFWTDLYCPYVENYKVYQKLLISLCDIDNNSGIDHVSLIKELLKPLQMIIDYRFFLHRMTFDASETSAFYNQVLNADVFKQLCRDVFNIVGMNDSFEKISELENSISRCVKCESEIDVFSNNPADRYIFNSTNSIML